MRISNAESNLSHGRTLYGRTVKPLAAVILGVFRGRGRGSIATARSRETGARSRAAFLAGMGHEFRTPLTAIMGFSDILLRQDPGTLAPARQREYMECIHASSAHLLELVNDWLDLSRLEAGRMELSETRVDPAVLLHQVLRLVRAQASDSGLTLKARIAGGLPAIRADRRMLIQVLLNLLSNAIKYTPSGGRVTLEARRLSGGGLRIAVCDSGIGLESSDIALLADPFVQVDNAVNRRTRGSGLGLYLARTMVELHEAKLAISSLPGEGFCASFVLPRQRIIESPAAAEA